MKDNIPYSKLDRAIHKIAFKSNILQNVMSDIETTLLTKKWENITLDRPVFITSLPRAGTTIILEALFRLPGLAVHTYRDMPFVLTPVLWKSLAGHFYKQSLQKERAHGDGLKVNEDSPEAFEEVLWKKFYPEHYLDDKIIPWNKNDLSNEFKSYLSDHLKKIISIRRDSEASTFRYVSKNNGNIARIELLREMLPDACVIIPIRQPLEHAISLWRQHINFIKQHKENPFISEYMADIGHYEFGELHRPIAFEGLATLVKDYNPSTIDYWLKYWIISFEYLNSLHDVHFISYEALCNNAVAGLTQLVQHLGIQANQDQVRLAASILRAPPPPRQDQYEISAELVQEATELHSEIVQHSLFSTAS